jgi:DnaJ-domain-containing protein 1
MGISKRLLDLAKANLNALLDKTNGDTSVDELTDEELEAELERRRERRRRAEQEIRDREAAERAARERAAQRAATARERAATARERAAHTAGSTGARSNNARRPIPPGSERRLRELYAQLEVPYGASFDEVKRSFRRLMRKYHPDLHVGNPTKHRAATQLTMSLTQAYNEIETHLVGARNGSK